MRTSVLQAILTSPGHGARSTALIVIEGDASQLTLCALRVLNQADMLFAGNDVAPEVLEPARRDAPRQRLAHLDDGLVMRIAAMSDQGTRAVVVPRDASTAATVGHALRSRSEGGERAWLTD